MCWIWRVGDGEGETGSGIGSCVCCGTVVLLFSGAGRFSVIVLSRGVGINVDDADGGFEYRDDDDEMTQGCVFRASSYLILGSLPQTE